MTWKGQHFSQEPVALVDPEGVHTGLFDPTRLNWLAYLVAQEGQRLSQALFGEPGRWRFMTSLAWPSSGNQPETPMLYIIPSEQAKPVGWTGKRGVITKTYSDGEKTRTVSFDEPQCHDIAIVVRVAVRNEYPILDLEAAVQRAFEDLGNTIALAGERIVVTQDVPAWRWNPSDDDTVLSEQTWIYRSVPTRWTSTIVWGTVMTEAELEVGVLKDSSSQLDDVETEVVE